MQKSFNEIVEEIVRKDPRYEAAAYEFVKEALEFTIKQNKRNQTGLNAHVTAKELLAGFQQYALKEFGPMVMTVFEYWRVNVVPCRRDNCVPVLWNWRFWPDVF